ncbi:MAG TPA: tetraacyldisaccharide 4'-kinase [Thermoanaerobaculia bacterium]|nr:tetraacyldisaccharide 4'-kinase [Thermoanaerobaculia bacterium]
MKLDLTAPAPPRSPWQRLYALGLERRRRAWAGRAGRLGRPAVSVGNLHWGGGGKTPLVAALSGLLRDTGRRVGILSRGYGRRGREPCVVSVGQGPLVAPEQAGDEPFLLAEQLAGVAIAVCGDRRAAARALLARTGVDCFVLDDAFSHVKLHRDLDLLAFPAADPFAGGRLLPSGRLREPLAASRRADAALITGLDHPDREAASLLARALAPHGFRGASFACGLDSSLIGPSASRHAGAPAEPPSERFLLVSGTARPGSVRQTADRLGLEVVEHLRFPDHHAYPQRSLEAIRRRAADLGAAVLTTAKDRVKLAGRLGRPLWEIVVDARPESGFGPWVEEHLAAVEARASSSAPSGP